MNYGSLEDLLHAQPWRSRIGAPRNALDPTWAGEDTDTCDGELEWEEARWGCLKCGYVGHGSYVRHKPAIRPTTFLRDSQKLLEQKLRGAGMCEDDVKHAIEYIAGVALRVAVSKHPKEIVELLRKIEELKSP